MKFSIALSLLVVINLIITLVFTLTHAHVVDSAVNEQCIDININVDVVDVDVDFDIIDATDATTDVDVTGIDVTDVVVTDVDVTDVDVDAVIDIDIDVYDDIDIDINIDINFLPINTTPNQVYYYIPMFVIISVCFEIFFFVNVSFALTSTFINHIDFISLCICIGEDSNELVDTSTPYQIFIHDVNNNSFAIMIDNHYTVRDVKGMISNHTAYDNNPLPIYYNGKLLNDHLLVSLYDIQKESTIYVCGRLLGGVDDGMCRLCKNKRSLSYCRLCVVSIKTIIEHNVINNNLKQSADILYENHLAINPEQKNTGGVGPKCPVCKATTRYKKEICSDCVVMIFDITCGVVNDNVIARAEIMLTEYQNQCHRHNVRRNARNHNRRETGGGAYAGFLERNRAKMQNHRASKRQRIHENEYDENNPCNKYIAHPFWLSSLWTDTCTTELNYELRMQALSASMVVKYIEITYLLAQKYVIDEELDFVVNPPTDAIGFYIIIRFESDINPSGTASKQVVCYKCPMAFTEEQRTNISTEEDEHNYNYIYNIALAIEYIHNLYVKGGRERNTLDNIIDGCERDLHIVGDTNDTIKNDIINSLETIRDDLDEVGDTVCVSLLCNVTKSMGQKPVQELLLAVQALGMGCSKTGQLENSFLVGAFEDIIKLSGMTRELFLHCFWFGSAMFDGSYLVSAFTSPSYIEWLLGSDSKMLGFFKKYIEEYFPDIHENEKIVYTQKTGNVKTINIATITDFDVAKLILQRWHDCGCSDESHGVPMKNYNINRILRSNGRSNLQQTLEEDKEHYEKIDIINYYRTNDGNDQHMALKAVLVLVASVTTVTATCVAAAVVVAAAAAAGAASIVD